MRRFGLLGACLAVFVALTVIPPAGAAAPEPRITKCVRVFGITDVQWNDAWLDQFGKGAAVTSVTFEFSAVSPPDDIAIAVPEGRSAEVVTPFQAETVNASLSISGQDDDFFINDVPCTFFGNPQGHLDHGKHVANGRQP